FLVQRYRSVKDPLSRNRIAYLLVGVAIFVLLSSRSAIPPLPQYPLEQIGHLGNALLIAYAVMRYRMLDIKLVARKGLAYSGVSVFVSTFYLLILLGLQHVLRSWTSSASYVAIFGMAFCIALIFNPLIRFFQRGIDRLFYGETYEYRQLIIGFAQRMSNVIDIDELAEAMLKPITRAVNATQVSLLLLNNEKYTPEYTEKLIKGKKPINISISKETPLVKWLTENDRPISLAEIQVTPNLRDFLNMDVMSAQNGGIELLVPVKSKGRLTGIFALGGKESGGRYSSDDIELVTTLAHEAAVGIENAQLYAHAKERAHIDELTGLYNHRYFHERLDEEIGRCSRFGDIFSLLFLDMDLFKTYNDVYGHLAGDELLRDIGKSIKGSIRGIDMAFRYGGDEFTVILPQASLDDAHSVAERIRKRVESEMDSKGVALTCSAGIASWPTDGVMREELLQAADAALYHSKEAGRNRITVASEVTRTRVLGSGVRAEGETGVLSTIYALAATVDAKDHYTYGHSKKVSKYATDIAEALGYSDDKIATIRAAGLLHDIGKIGVSDGVLMKPGTLDSDDWEAIRAHPKLGVAILKHVSGLSACLAAIQYHHERYDGTGYPARLKGENIPLDARILSIADSYDAMTSLRPYREGKMTQEEALAELKRCSGTQFDPKIVDIFIATRAGRKLREVELDASHIEASATG
ncbi:MAG: diguanylate cyclase, partial [Dehalococcoidia bacterium]